MKKEYKVLSIGLAALWLVAVIMGNFPPSCWAMSSVLTIIILAVFFGFEILFQ